MKRAYLITIVILLALGAGVFIWEQQRNQQISLNPESDIAIETDNFVLDVDPNTDLWKTQETEFFTIKFPKEWYWIELPPEEPGQGSTHVISNNPGFPIGKYPDIGIFTEGSYPLIFTNKTEMVLTYRIWPTSNSGSPKGSIDWQIEHAKKYVDSDANCDILSNSTPISAYCSLVDRKWHYRMQIYNIAYDVATFAFNIRTTEDVAPVSEDVLEKIAKSLIVKDPDFH